MASHGTKDGDRLRQNVEDQLNRLLQQLQDLDDMKEDMEMAEYESSRQDTLEQMKEFEVTLEKLMSGDMNLQTQLDVCIKPFKTV